jgi:hypothetical protein
MPDRRFFHHLGRCAQVRGTAELANYPAIAATSQAILSLLENACPRSEFAGARFELYQASNFQSPMDEGVSLYLYRVGINATIRNMTPRPGPDGKRYRPALPLDLFYMLTSWAKSAVKQQRLLGWCMRTLEDTPILPPGLLNQLQPEREVFHPFETVELVCDPLSLQDIANMWEIFRSNLQVSVTYVARMIAIDSTIEVIEGLPVAQTRDFEVEKVIAG